MTLRTLRPVSEPAPSDRRAEAGAGIALGRMAAHFAKTTVRPGADPRFNGTVSLFDPRAAGYQDPILVTANGSAGAKLKIAIATGLHETIGLDLVANVGNLVLAHGAEPLSFHYYHCCGAADLAIADRLLAGIAEGCRQSGATLSGGQTVELPGVFEEGEYDLSGHCTGTVERIGLLPRYDCAEGDVLLGLAASGPHAHGYGLIRRIVGGSGLSYRDAAPFAPSQSLGGALMQPTRAYAPVVGSVLRATPAIKCVVPVTYGGLSGSLARALPTPLAARIDLTSWRLPPVFHWLQRAGELTNDDLLNCFNCGLGMVLVVDKLRTVSALKVLREMGEKPLAIGTLVNRSGGDPVRFSGALSA